MAVRGHAIIQPPSERSYPRSAPCTSRATGDTCNRQTGDLPDGMQPPAEPTGRRLSPAARSTRAPSEYASQAFAVNSSGTGLCDQAREPPCRRHRKATNGPKRVRAPARVSGAQGIGGAASGSRQGPPAAPGRGVEPNYACGDRHRSHRRVRCRDAPRHGGGRPHRNRSWPG